MQGEQTGEEIEKFKMAQKFLLEKKIACHAGHGLTDESLAVLLETETFEEYNIGHWIISQSVFDGLGNVVGKLKTLCENHPLK